jgi:hypothetical protein
MINIDINNLRQELTDEKLKPLRTIVIGLNTGVILFFFVTLILYFKNMPGLIPEKQPAEIYNILLILLAVMTSVILYASKKIPPIIFKKSTNIISAITSYYIIKLALLESVVFFGLVIFLFAIQNSVIYANNIIWLSIIPLFLFLFISLLNFPGTQNIIVTIKEIVMNNN